MKYGDIITYEDDLPYNTFNEGKIIFKKGTKLKFQKMIGDNMVLAKIGRKTLVLYKDKVIVK